MSVKAIFVASALAASSLVNAAVIPTARQVSAPEQTCEGQKPGYKYVTRLASNVQYEVICGADYYGSDLADGIKWPGSFQGCLAECDANADCKAISWANGPCYLKGGVPQLTNGNDAIWTAMKNPAPTCEGDFNSNGASYITSAGIFEISCGVDYAGNDLPDSNKRVDSFADCIELCAADDRCVDVSYEYGACYPKSAASNLVDKASIWTAKLSGSRSGAPEVPKALTCVGEGNDDGKHYKNFEIQCGNDHGGADIGAVPTTTTFEQCMDACEENGECVAVSWVWGTCYMKNAANPGQTNVGHVWGAVRPARVASSSVAVEPSVTATISVDASATASVDALAEITASASSEATPVVSSIDVVPTNVSSSAIVPEVTASIEVSSSATPTPSPTELSTLVTLTSSTPAPTSTIFMAERK
ncbi:hypothetical protein E8E13_006059 [Curvularia kusanoi]|uniref:Apple domain-containing protein n=1 Tax=Curvularia kusanoi TaxID=90978 RepID=A0A9P4T800_CURKU|nr:hypothetical protein E8E13_006059 [Curvularia kusanoi]